MKVAFLVPSLSRTGGGIFEVARSLATSLSAYSDTEVNVFGLIDEFTAIDACRWDSMNVAAHVVWGPRKFGYSPSLRKAVLECAADVAHLHALWSYMSVVTFEWSRVRNRPYVISLNGMLDPWALRNAPLKKWVAQIGYESRSLHKASCIQVASEAELAAAKSFGLRNPICIIPNGVTLPDLTVQKPEDTTSKVHALKRRGHRVLLYLGRLHPKKNLLSLIRALPMVHDQGGEWVLVIAGWGQAGHEAELRRLVEHLSLGDRVIFLGPQYGVAKEAILRQADAFVLPSYSEGLPMAVLDAWAYAKPVLMTPACNLAVGYQCGAAIRIDPDPASIAEGLRCLFEMSRAERTRLGVNGHQIAIQRFSWPSVAAQIRSVYAWLSGGGSAPDCVVYNPSVRTPSGCFWT